MQGSLELSQLRHLKRRRGTPGGPEMEQEQAALIITEARSFSLYGGEGESRSLCRRLHRLESHLFE